MDVGVPAVLAFPPVEEEDQDGGDYQDQRDAKRDSQYHSKIGP